MTPPSAQTPSVPLDPATIAGIQSAAINAMPPRPGAADADKAAQRAYALAFLAALCPADPVQAMIAVHIIASHHAAMECFRLAARGDLSMDMHLRIMGKAVALCRMIERSMRDLTQRQGVPGPRRAAARPAAEPAVRAQPVTEVARESAPAQPAVAESRHERRRRERAERHLATAGRRTGVGAGAGAGAVEKAMQERLVAEMAARSAASARMVAA